MSVITQEVTVNELVRMPDGWKVELRGTLPTVINLKDGYTGASQKTLYENFLRELAIENGWVKNA